MITVWMLALGRVVYGCGYCKKGPHGRLVGAIMVDLALLGGLVGSIYTLATWSQVDGVISFGTQAIPKHA